MKTLRWLFFSITTMMNPSWDDRTELATRPASTITTQTSSSMSSDTDIRQKSSDWKKSRPFCSNILCFVRSDWGDHGSGSAHWDRFRSVQAELPSKCSRAGLFTTPHWESRSRFWLQLERVGLDPTPYWETRFQFRLKFAKGGSVWTSSWRRRFWFCLQTERVCFGFNFNWKKSVHL